MRDDDGVVLDDGQQHRIRMSRRPLRRPTVAEEYLLHLHFASGELDVPHVPSASLGDGRDAVEARAETQVDHVGREATQQRRLTRQAVDGAHEAIFNGVASKGVVDGHDGADRVDRRRLALVADDLFSGQVLARARPCQ